MRSKLHRAPAAATGAVLVLLGAAVAVHWHSSRQLEVAAQGVTHTREALGTLEQASRLNVEMENALRGFVITRDEALLAPLNRARDQVPVALARLRTLTGNDPVQHERVAALERMVADHVAQRTAAVESARAADRETARAQLAVEAGEGERRLDAIHEAIAAIRATEEERLRERERATDAATRLGAMTLAALAGFAAAVVIGGYLWLRRALTARSVAQDALRRSEEELSAMLESIDEQVRRRTDALRESEQRLRATLEQTESLRAAAQKDLERRLIEQTEALHFAAEELAAKNLALAQASRRTSEYLSTLSDALHAPLNSILGVSRTLRDGQAGEPTPWQRECAADIQASAAHMVARISDIRDLANIESGSMPLEREDMNIVPLLESCLAIVRDEAEARNIELRKQIDASLGALEGDPSKLRQIVTHLLANAVKFTERGGRVSLAARRIDRARIDAGVAPGALLHAPSAGGRAFVEIAVQDTGIGIAGADLARLFQPFVQGDGSARRGHDGAGLGLALVRRLVDLHGGGLAVESTPGRGSRFTVWLPYRPLARDVSAVDAAHGEGS